MEDDLFIRSGLAIPGSELGLTASRSGGPGGQHVNKTSSRVTLSWSVAESSALSSEERARLLSRLASRLTVEGVLQLSVDDERSQHRNRAVARERLAELVRRALAVPRKRVPTRPSAGAKRRRLEAKRREGEKKRRRSGPPEEG